MNSCLGCCFTDCPSGLFGENCANFCGYCLNGEACDPVSGKCPGSKCEAGWEGPMCKQGKISSKQISESYPLHFVVILRSILIFQLFTGKSFIFQNVKNINMEPRVSMTAGIALISRTAKKHRESAKRVVTVAGMDRTAIIVSNNKDCGKI